MTDVDRLAEAYVAGEPLLTTMRTLQRFGGLIGVNRLFWQQSADRPVEPHRGGAQPRHALLDRRARPALGARWRSPCPRSPTGTSRTSSSTPGPSRSPTSAPAPPAGEAGTWVVTPPGWEGELPDGADGWRRARRWCSCSAGSWSTTRPTSPNVTALCRQVSPRAAGRPHRRAGARAHAAARRAGGPPQAIPTDATFWDELGDALAINPPPTAAQRETFAGGRRPRRRPRQHPAADAAGDARRPTPPAAARAGRPPAPATRRGGGAGRRPHRRPGDRRIDDGAGAGPTAGAGQAGPSAPTATTRSSGRSWPASAGAPTCPRSRCTPWPGSTRRATGSTAGRPTASRSRPASCRRSTPSGRSPCTARTCSWSRPHRPLRHRRPHPGPHRERRRLAHPRAGARRGGRRRRGRRGGAGQLAARPRRPLRAHAAPLPPPRLGARRQLRVPADRARPRPDAERAHHASARSEANTASASHATPWRENHRHTVTTSRCNRSSPLGLTTRSTACGKSIIHTRPRHHSRL